MAPPPAASAGAWLGLGGRVICAHLLQAQGVGTALTGDPGSWGCCCVQKSPGRGAGREPPWLSLGGRGDAPLYVPA